VFKAADLERALDCALDSPATTAAVALAVLLMVPALPNPDTVGTESREGPRSGAYPSHAQDAYKYQMRCWQHGHLMLEQNLGDLPADRTRYPLAVSGSDSEGRLVYVAETKGNATCVIRSCADAAAPPQP
jgi:hypothetical protein